LLAIAAIGLTMVVLFVFVWPGFLGRGAEPVEGRLVFQGRDESGYGIFTMRGDGADVRAVSIPIERSLGFPRFSPDGRFLAFIAESEDGSEDLYVADASGRDPKVIAPSPGAPEGAPAWAPDGSAIAFSTRRDGNWEIYSVRPDGTDLKRLTNDPAFDAAPAWAPDGSGIIAFSSDRGGVDSHLYVMARDGSGVQRLTNGDDEAVPDWSPDGSMIAYAGFSGGNADIWVRRADGSSPRRLTTGTIFQYTPRWSPDGRWIAFEAYVGDNPDIFIVHPDGSAIRRLTSSGLYSGSPAWFTSVPT
jgi:Tol biopolymer transport system component